MSEARPLSAAIIAVGTELILEGCVDTNGVTITRTLAGLGIQTARRVLVGDDEEEIALALSHAADRHRLVIVTGGLGPTVDDVTREALARAFGLELRENTELLEGLKQRYRARGREIDAWGARQALVPVGAEPLPNAAGSAPGLLLKRPGGVVVLLPGVPHEMTRMLTEQVVPRLKGLFLDSGPPPLSLGIRASGLTEMEVQTRILDLFEDPNTSTAIQLTLLASPGEISIIIRGKDAARLRTVHEAVRSRLGEAVFSLDTDAKLEKAVGGLLVERGLTLAVAESCTGGLLGALITSVPGASRWFEQGWVTYADAAKTRLLEVPPELIARHGAVSEEVATAMAVAARRLSGADIAAALTGIAGPDGGSVEKPVGLVFICVASEAGCRTTRHLFAGDREMIRLYAARTALNRIRLEAP